jgi:NADH-quinone oxidoreductase subunit L
MLFWLVPILPLGSFALLACGLGRFRRVAAGLSVAALAASTVLSGFALLAAREGDRAFVTWQWVRIGGRQLSLELWLDPLSAVMAALVSLISLVVFVYAVSYMADDPHRGRFFTLFCLFSGAMLTLVLAGDLLMLFIAWEIVGLCSYLLIGFWFQKPGVPAAATKAFLTTRIADLVMLAGVLLLVGALGTGRIESTIAAATDGRLAPEFISVIALLLFAGAAGKSAQVPFQGWLPDAMVGPTPVSALLHSATMVAAGVFLVARFYPLFLAAGPALLIVAWVGAITALLGAAAALVQTDLKRTLAYSTMSQLGLMFVGLGSGSLIAGLLLLISQALYKATLFLAAGAIDHAVGSTVFERMGGLARRMPFTFLVFVIGAAALAGLPVTLALPPKDPALAAAWEANGALFAVSLLASLMTALYSARALGLVFLGAPSESARRAHESSTGLLAPMLALTVMVVIGLLVDSRIVGQPLSALFRGHVLESQTATVLAVVVAVSGVGIGLGARRAWPYSIIWPPLARIANILTGEFGLKLLYDAITRFGLGFSRALSLLDLWVFDPIGNRAGELAMELVRGGGRFERAIFDPASAMLANLALGAIKVTANFDRTVFDAAASKLTSCLITAVAAISHFDLHRLDAVFNSFGQIVLTISQHARNLQTGRIENYLLAIFIWSIGMIALAFTIAIR